MTNLYFNTSSSLDSSEEEYFTQKFQEVSKRRTNDQNIVYSSFMPSSDAMCTMVSNCKYRPSEVKSAMPDRPSHLPSLVKQGDYK